MCHNNSEVCISIGVGFKHACAQVYVLHDDSACCLLPCQTVTFKISMNLLLCESHKPANLTDGVLVAGNCPHGFKFWSQQFSTIVMISSSDVFHSGTKGNPTAAVVMFCFPMYQGCKLNILVEGPHCFLITHSAVTCGFACPLLSLVCSLYLSLIQI